MPLTSVKIILVEPAGPLNVGSVARVMKNFGLQQLILVNPQCDHLGAEARLMAVHASSILDNAVLVTSLPQALKGCKRAIATTGTIHDWEAPVETPRAALPWLMEESGQPSALIFGREDRGLSKQELNYAQKFVRIPSSPEYSSLNLASAVAVCCYEMGIFVDGGVKRDEGDEGVKENKKSNKVELASLDAVETYYRELESLLINIGYLYPHTAGSRMEKFRQLYNRAGLQNRELAMLRGILRQLEWAIEQQKNSKNL
ncbi:MAG: RNA methyltransferase [Scytonematopsis contorta HA4267-MV1]|jgi:tRNA/rRNA methyltransferase|nr:RNA methyltransferase [Scytonematopsis contorta HA4267-MV1]